MKANSTFDDTLEPFNDCMPLVIRDATLRKRIIFKPKAKYIWVEREEVNFHLFDGKHSGVTIFHSSECSRKTDLSQQEQKFEMYKAKRLRVGLTYKPKKVELHLQVVRWVNHCELRNVLVVLQMHEQWTLLDRQYLDNRFEIFVTLDYILLSNVFLKFGVCVIRCGKRVYFWSSNRKNTAIGIETSFWNKFFYLPTVPSLTFLATRAYWNWAPECLFFRYALFLWLI